MARLHAPSVARFIRRDLRQRIGAPVETGDLLFEVAPLGALRAELARRRSVRDFSPEPLPPGLLLAVEHNADAALAAVAAVDRCLAEVRAAVDDAGGELLVTADHGNIEQMTDPSTGQSHTAHTTNPVPFLFHGRPAHFSGTGSLRDIAPTMLYLLGLEQPKEMTGRSLLELTGDAAA